MSMTDKIVPKKLIPEQLDFILQWAELPPVEESGGAAEAFILALLGHINFLEMVISLLETD